MGLDDLRSHQSHLLWLSGDRAAKFQLHVRARAVNLQRNMVEFAFQTVAKAILYHQLCLGMISVTKALCLSQALPFLTGFLGDIQLLTSCSTLCATSTQIPPFRILCNRQQRILDISSRPMRYANYPPDFTHPAQYSAITELLQPSMHKHGHP